MGIAEKLLIIAQNEPKVFEAGKVGKEKNITLPEFNTPVFADELQTIAENVLNVYNAGRQSVTNENIWDEQWEVGIYSTTTGNFLAEGQAATAICVASHHSNPISVLPNMVYSFTSTFRLYVFFYDESDTYISYSGVTNSTLTTPENCKYMRFYVHKDYGQIYLNDIFINLV